jgi:NTP pyrophosphatase (non-canonical NTP hydrolase)
MFRLRRKLAETTLAHVGLVKNTKNVTENSMALKDYKEKSLDLIKRFEAIEPKRWSVEGSSMELMTEVGDLIDLILRKEYYKQNVYDDLDYQIKDELADIILILFAIAEHYKIDLDESYEEMLKIVDERLKSKGL